MSPAHTWKRSGGTCFFTRWPWTCSMALFEKGWGREGTVNSPQGLPSLPDTQVTVGLGPEGQLAGHSHASRPAAPS